MATTTAPDRSSRIRTAFYCLAICDALGGPLEFHRRCENPAEYERDMIPNFNFNLPPGHFTDDTSMALCLAASLTETAKNSLKPSNQTGEGSSSTKTDITFHDPVDQASRYVQWVDKGYMSSVPGYAFDVGIQTTQAIQYWRSKPTLKTLDVVKKQFNFERKGGNGSLMRVLPCALIARTENEAAELGRRSSEVTHSHATCVDSCAVYCVLVFWSLEGAPKESLAEGLKDLMDGGIELVGEDSSVVNARLGSYRTLEDWQGKKRSEISSSGYVIDSLEAALWAFFGTSSFEEGAIEVVNLGDDADTVGAIYGGIAGAFYGRTDCIPERWMESMKKFRMVEEVVDQLLEVVAAIREVK